ncbi:MAG: signal recognition particle-docking protein FtsY [Nanoarchaeota archaeon]
MFKSLKDKLKKAVSIFSKRVEEEAVQESIPETAPAEALEKPDVSEAAEIIEEVEEHDDEMETAAQDDETTATQTEVQDAQTEPETPQAEDIEIETVEQLKAELQTKEEEAESEAETVEFELDSAPTPEEQPEEAVEPITIEIPEEKETVVEEKKGFLKRMFSKKEEKKHDVQAAPPTPDRLQRLKDTFTKIHLSEEKFNEIFWDLEVALLENNVAVQVIEKIKEDLARELTQEKLSRKRIEDIIHDTLKASISELFDVESIDLMEEISKKQPYIIAFIGVNGSGKTTTLAKVAYYLQQRGIKSVIAAADTFRAAAIQQIEEHANRLGIKLISQGYGADPAAVAFDAIEHAKAQKIPVVLIDTAGRLHSNDNLMNELKKIIRVAKPDLKVFVGESTTGNDCVEQCTIFNEAVGIDAIILAKADVDDKGGAAVSASFVTKRPIIFLATGQNYTDLTPFEKKTILDNLGL